MNPRIARSFGLLFSSFLCHPACSAQNGAKEMGGPMSRPATKPDGPEPLWLSPVAVRHLREHVRASLEASTRRRAAEEGKVARIDRCTVGDPGVVESPVVEEWPGLQFIEMFVGSHWAVTSPQGETYVMGHGRKAFGIEQRSPEPVDVEDPLDLGRFLIATGAKVPSGPSLLWLLNRVCFGFRERNPAAEVVETSHGYVLTVGESRWRALTGDHGRLRSFEEVKKE